MADDGKWYLSATGRNVEKILYDYGITLPEENAVHSFILDVSDTKVAKLFSEEEWDEILCLSDANTIDLPESVTNILQQVNSAKGSINDIQDVIIENTRARYADFYVRQRDFVCCRNFVKLEMYKQSPNPLLSLQDESWYCGHIWIPLIDRFFEDINYIKITRNGPAS